MPPPSAVAASCREHLADDLGAALAEPGDAREPSIVSGSLELLERLDPQLAVDCPLSEVARSLADHQIGAVPVLDKFGALVGIVSYIDALRTVGV